VQNGVEDTTSEAARKWAPAFENYTFNDKDGATEVRVDLDVEDEHVQMFNEMWAKGLRKLKELAEKEKAFVAKEKFEIVLSAPVKGEVGGRGGMDIRVECVTPDGLSGKKRVWFRGIFHLIGILRESPFVSKLRKAESAQHSVHMTWGSLRHFRAFSSLRVFPAPKHCPHLVHT
jgi:hypothetical protein